MGRFSRLLMLALLAARVAGAAVTANTGYAVRTIDPDPNAEVPVQGGVLRRGDVILVGQGPAFTAGAQTIIRFTEGGAPTTIATGFNSLGGFDLDAAGTLYAVDNCLADGCGATTTGDTLYAIPDALTRTTAVSADTVEVVPAGTIPFAMDVLVAPDGAALVSDPSIGAGRIVRVFGGAASNLVDAGLDFVAGPALSPAGTLLVGNCVLDFMTFLCDPGELREYSLAGALLGTLASSLPNVFGLAVDREGKTLVSGGPSLVAVDRTGSVVDRATGFAFAGDVYFDAARDEALVLDAGATVITAICREQDGDGHCDADDDCPAVANADQADADGDASGDACDACTGGVAVERAKLLVAKLATPPGDDVLVFKGELMLPAAPAVDPVASGVRFAVADATGSVIDAVVPGGAFDPASGTGWKARNGVFRSRATLGGALGKVKVKVKTFADRPGLVRFVVTARGGAYPGDPANLPLRGTFALAADRCGDTTFAGSACLHKPERGKVRCR